MKKLIKKILILIVLVVLADISLGFLLNKILLNSPDGRYYKANYTLNKAKEEVIIYGSSRAETNYAPHIIEDSLKLSCWNTGRGGQTLPFWYSMQEGVLKRYTPTITILNVEDNFLSGDLNDESYERAGFLRPFYYNNPETRPMIERISKSEKFLLNSKLYAYNSSFYYLLRPYLLENLDGKISDKGWKVKSGILKESNKNIKTIQTKEELNDETVKLFDMFISNIKEKGSEIYIVVSPNYGYNIESTSTIEYIKNIKNINFINFGNDSSFYENHLLFNDFEHLNRKGAIKFTEKLSSKINENKKYVNFRKN